MPGESLKVLKHLCGEKIVDPTKVPACGGAAGELPILEMRHPGPESWRTKSEKLGTFLIHWQGLYTNLEMTRHLQEHESASPVDDEKNNI